MYNSSPNGTTATAIKAIASLSGTFQEHILRPFVGIGTPETATAVAEATMNGGNITGKSLAGASGGMMQIKAQSNSRGQMPNGYGKQRVKLWMEISIVAAGMPVVYEVIGYTDVDNVTACDYGEIQFDDAMNVSINRITQKVNTGFTVQGKIVNRISVGSNHEVLTGNGTPAQLRRQVQGIEEEGDVTRSQRPADVMYVTGVMDLSVDPGMISTNAMTFNSERRVKLSDNANAMSQEYLAGSLNSVVENVRSMGIDSNDETAHLYSAAADMASDEQLSSNLLVTYLTNNTSYGNTGSVTWGALCNVISNLRNTITFAKHRQGDEIASAHSAANMNNIKPSTVKAQEILQQSLALAAAEDLIELELDFSNMNATGSMMASFTPCEIEVGVNANPLTTNRGMDISQASARYIQRFCREVMTAITLGGRHKMHGKVIIKPHGDSTISFSMDGGDIVTQRHFSAASGLITPTLTRDIKTQVSTAKTVKAMVDHISAIASVNPHAMQTSIPVNRTDAIGPIHTSRDPVNTAVPQMGGLSLTGNVVVPGRR